MAQYPASIDLELLGTTGYTFRNPTAGNWLGYSVHIAGDVNGDFITDFLIGAPGEDPLPGAAVPHTQTGKALLVFGGTANLAALDAADGTVDNVINPANINGTTGYVFQGIAAGDQAGASVWGGSDLDGDNDADILIGSPSFADSTAPGAVFIISGGASNLADLDTADGTTDGVIQLSNASSGGYTISGGILGDHAGFSVSSVHDLNGDGFSDFLIGANLADPASVSAAGEAYLVFGGPTGLGALDAADGNTDHNIDLSNLSSSTGYVFFSGTVDDQAGIAVAGIQDVNGDGETDLLVGAWMANPGGRNNAGNTFIVFGGAANLAALDTAGGAALDGRINLSAVNGTTGYALDGAVINDKVGLGLAATDIDGDGVADLILGAYLADPQAPSGNQGGEAYIIFGGAARLAATDTADGTTNGRLSPSQLNGTHGYRIISEGPVDWLGYSIAAAGDVNGDGFNDIIVGANYGDSGGGLSGDTFIVFGGAANLASWDAADGTTDGRLDVDFLNGTNGFRLRGVDAGDESGSSVASAGDLNFDGLADLLVGAPRGAGPANGASLAGEAYVVFGRLPDAAVNRTGTAQGQNLVGGNFNDTLSGLAGDDILYGHGGNDTLDGGGDNDVLLADEGDDTLRGGGGNDTFDGGSGTDTADFSLAAGPITVNLSLFSPQATGEGNDTFFFVENVTGSGVGDSITGDVNANRLDGGDGGDTLNGGNNNDTLIGGLGNDTLNGGNDIDTADYSGATAAVTVSLLTTAQQNTVSAGLDTISNVENLTGSVHNDTLTGSNGINVLNGGNGQDKLNGRNGNDTLNGGIGNDTLNGGGGDDVMTGGVGNDFYIVDSQDDVINEESGGGNADKLSTSVSYTLAEGVDIEIFTAAAGAPGLALTGNELGNKIYGSANNDTIDGGDGSDFMFGGAGDDSYVVSGAGDRANESLGGGTDLVTSSVAFNLGANVENLTLSGAANINGNGNELNNTMFGNSGENKLFGFEGIDTIDGEGGDDTIFGGAGEDILVGCEGDDKVFGGDDADTIVGQGGRDVLAGDSGNDVFVYELLTDTGTTVTTRDQIMDFVVGADTIDLSQLDAIAGDDDDAFNFVGSGPFQNAGDLRAFASGANTIIAGDVNGDLTADFHILLQGSIAITATDFVL